jgi:hypothetical protein
VAALFYGQARASPEDVAKLTQLLGISPESNVGSQMMGFPDRGRAGPMPPVEPLIYRLYEIVQNYGYAFKAVMNEKFGDGIMSAICFNTKVEKEVVGLSHFLLWARWSVLHEDTFGFAGRRGWLSCEGVSLCSALSLHVD